MTVSFVGAQGNAGTTVTIPAHQVGDLILIFAYRDGSNTVPTAPTAGGTVPTWTQIGSSGANTNSSRLHFATATATNTTSGTWTNATELICLVYRGATVGASAGTSGSATTSIAYPALTLQRTNNTSWVVGVAGHRSATNVDLAPTGMTNRAFAGTEAAGHDTNGTRSSWTQQTVTVNASSAYRSWTVELRDKTIVLVAEKGTFTQTGKDATLVRASNLTLTAEKGTFTHTGKDATLRHAAVLTGDVRALTVSGVATNLLHAARLVAEARVFTLTGNDAGLNHNIIITADTGVVTLSGNAAPFIAGKYFPVFPGSFTVTGNNADIHYVAGIDINVDRGSFLVAGGTATLSKGFILVASTRAFYIAGIDANIIDTNNQDKPFYYQTIETDPRKMIIPTGSGDQLVYYVNPYLRIL